jgi:hypothetical protein
MGKVACRTTPGAQDFQRLPKIFLYTDHIRAGEMAERLKAAVC